MHFCGMQWTVPVDWFFTLMIGRRRAEHLRLAKQLHLLRYKGIETTAELIDVTMLEYKTGNNIPLLLWVRMEMPEKSLVYTHAYTLVSRSGMPHRGEKLRIKYLPDDISTVLIVGA